MRNTGQKEEQAEIIKARIPMKAANTLPLAVEPFPQLEGIFLLSRNRSYLWWVSGSGVGVKLAKGIAIRYY